MAVKKILFICGSLEPGEDGVGDYTRELAGAVESADLEVRILALMDRTVADVVEENQVTRHEMVSVIRISASLSFARRKVVFQEMMAEFNPDWISLQYVPYAFSPKGIPFKLTRLLETGRHSAKWHFMIHEAYVWDDLNFKMKLVGFFQKEILRMLIRTHKPALVNTSNTFYQSLLQAISIESELLGLFGNIEISAERSSISKVSELQGIYFGSGPRHSNFTKFLKGLKDHYRNSLQKINIVFCGRPDFRTKDFIDFLKKELSQTYISIIEKGPLDEGSLSALFLQSHFGISRESPALIGKSGTAISMLEHGLPLWVPLSENKRDQNIQLDFRSNQCFIDLKAMEKPKFRMGFEPESRLKQVSTQFLQSLSLN